MNVTDIEFHTGFDQAAGYLKDLEARDPGPIKFSATAAIKLLEAWMGGELKQGDKTEFPAFVRAIKFLEDRAEHEPELSTFYEKSIQAMQQHMKDRAGSKPAPEKKPIPKIISVEFK